MTVAGAAGLTAGLPAAMVDQAFAAGDNQAANQAKLEGAYSYIVVGAGASGAIVAGELSKTGAKVLVVESGGADTAPMISNPSIWFYNVGGPLDWKLPIAPVPQLNNRKFNMALGHVLGGGSSINAMVWSRGLERDYDTWERSGAKGWGFKDVLPTYKAQEDWEGGANQWRGVGGPVHIRKPGDPHPTAPAFIEAARQMGFPIIDDANGPMRPGAGYINMNIAADGSRVSSSRAFLRPNLDRPNLTLLLNTNVTKVVFNGDRASGVELITGDGVKSVRATREVILAAGTIHSAKLLMLSGVGDATQLRKLRIKPIANLRSVGQNLQDHVLVSGLVYQYKERCRTVRRTATRLRPKSVERRRQSFDRHQPCAGAASDRDSRGGRPFRRSPERRFHDRARAHSADQPWPCAACQAPSMSACIKRLRSVSANTAKNAAAISWPIILHSVSSMSLQPPCQRSSSVRPSMSTMPRPFCRCAMACPSLRIFRQSSADRASTSPNRLRRNAGYSIASSASSRKSREKRKTERFRLL